MDINSYIDRLSAVRDIVRTIGRETDLYAEVYNCETYWALRLYDTNEDEAYSKDFGSLDELASHIDAILVGVNLANGREV